MHLSSVKRRLWHAITAREMFIDYDVSSLKTVGFAGKVYAKSTDGTRVRACSRIFSRAFRIVIDDIIENGTQFQFAQYGSGEGFLSISTVTGDKFIEIKRCHGFKHVDPVDSLFTGLEITLTRERPGGSRDIISHVHVDNQRAARLAELANTRKYKIGRVKNYKDYLQQVYDEFPLVDRSDIRRIFKFGCQNLYKCVVNHCDALVFDNNGLVAYFGLFRISDRKQVIYMVPKLMRKARYMWKKLRMIWDGWFWFALPHKKFEELKDAIEKHDMVDYGKIVLHRTYDDALLNNSKTRAILKVKLKGVDFDDYRWFTKYIPDFKTDKAIIDDVIPYEDWLDVHGLTRVCRHYQVLKYDRNNDYGTYLKNKEPYAKMMEKIKKKKKKELGNA